MGIPIRKPSSGLDEGPEVISSDWADVRFAFIRASSLTQVISFESG